MVKKSWCCLSQEQGLLWQCMCVAVYQEVGVAFYQEQVVPLRRWCASIRSRCCVQGQVLCGQGHGPCLFMRGAGAVHILGHVVCLPRA